jgi:hypothetical protein
MANPWLEVPLADYEGHMEYAGQARMLARIFGETLRTLRPQSVAVLGAAGGNGFEHLIGGTAVRTVALDLNGGYLSELRCRFGDRIRGLEIVCGDLDDPAVGFAPVDLVHAALVLEYVDAERALARIHGWLQPQGALRVVLQLPDEASPKVTPSPFKNLAKLGGTMKLHDAEGFRRLAAKAGFAEVSHEVLTLPGGKRFYSAHHAIRAFGRPRQKV